MASDTVHTEPPRAATNTSARISVGRAISTSIRWATRLAEQPRGDRR